MTDTVEASSTTGRPAPPPRVRSLVVPIVLVAGGFAIAGTAGDTAGGVLWGLLAAGAMIGALRGAKIRLPTPDLVALALSLVASTWLSIRVMPDQPEAVDPLLAVQFGLAWIPAALVVGGIILRRGIRPSTSVAVAAVWTVAGAIAVPAAVAFGVLTPIESLGRNDVPSFGGGDYAVVAFSIGLLGGSALLAAVRRLPGAAALAAVVFGTVFSGAQVGFTIPGLVENIANIVNIPNFWPPDFGWAVGDTGTWWWVPSWEFGARPGSVNPIVETFRIAIVAALFGCGFGLPLAFLASKITAPSGWVYLVAKGFMNFIRTIPDLFWAMIFVASIGLGPFPGALALAIFSLAIMAKLLSETVDAIDPGPLEAARATGSRHFPAVRTAALPQVLPNYVAYALYIFEITIRASAILGLVGAGGIGRSIETQRSFFRFDRVLAIVIVIFGIVFIIEQISVWLRRRLV